MKDEMGVVTCVVTLRMDGVRSQALRSRFHWIKVLTIALKLQGKVCAKDCWDSKYTRETLLVSLNSCSLDLYPFLVRSKAKILFFFFCS